MQVLFYNKDWPFLEMALWLIYRYIPSRAALGGGQGGWDPSFLSRLLDQLVYESILVWRGEFCCCVLLRTVWISVKQMMCQQPLRGLSSACCFICFQRRHMQSRRSLQQLRVTLKTPSSHILERGSPSSTLRWLEGAWCTSDVLWELWSFKTLGREEQKKMPRCVDEP